MLRVFGGKRVVFLVHVRMQMVKNIVLCCHVASMLGSVKSIVLCCHVVIKLGSVKNIVLCCHVVTKLGSVKNIVICCHVVTKLGSVKIKYRDNQSCFSGNLYFPT